MFNPARSGPTSDLTPRQMLWYGSGMQTTKTKTDRRQEETTTVEAPTKRDAEAETTLADADDAIDEIEAALIENEITMFLAGVWPCGC